MFSAEFLQAIVEDAQTLSLLHERELDRTTLAALRDLNFPRNLGLLPESTPQQEAWQLAEMGVQCLPAQPTDGDMDDLAADFAAIYLTGAFGASPCESVWLDDDRLCFQGRMFEVRQLYENHGLGVRDWRCRPDDHLATQLQFLAFLSSRIEGDGDLRRLGQVLDEHLLRWLPPFSQAVMRRCGTAFYAGLSAVTAAWCDRLRDCIAATLNEARPVVAGPEKTTTPPPAPSCAATGKNCASQD